VIPIAFGKWASTDTESLVRPETAGKLAARLYSEIVGRIYRHADTGTQVMMLVAYGNTQSDLLQLHRPEVCYPAVGFNLLASDAVSFPIARGVSVPGRQVIAAKSDWTEYVAYWTRLGEFLPNSEEAQRADRFKNALNGDIPDGSLFRLSVTGSDSGQAFSELTGFIADLVLAVPKAQRSALIGTELANKLA
jgi:EpsI family protein